MSQTTARRTFQSIAQTATPSRERLIAWPTLAGAAAMLAVPVSTLTRAADAEGIVKYPYGRRDKKLAPDSVLDLALRYAVDVNNVAEQLMVYAEESGAAAPYVTGVEKTIGSWLAGRAVLGRGELDVDALVAAVQELVAPEIAAAILARAGLTG